MKKLLSILCLLPFVCLSQAYADAPAATASPYTTTTNAAPAETTAPDSVDPAKEAEIRKLLDTIGTVKLTNQIMEQMISNFRSRNNGVSKEFWDRFEQKMNAQDLVGKIVPIYAKYYTMDDLKAINAFYQTPAGQKVIASTPQIMHDSMLVGQEWGKHVSIDLMAELNEEKAKKEAADSAPASTNSAATVSTPPSTPPATNSATPAPTAQ
jgi:hypothetical protein